MISPVCNQPSVSLAIGIDIENNLLALKLDYSGNRSGSLGLIKL